MPSRSRSVRNGPTPQVATYAGGAVLTCLPGSDTLGDTSTRAYLSFAPASGLGRSWCPLLTPLRPWVSLPPFLLSLTQHGTSPLHVEPDQLTQASLSWLNFLTLIRTKVRARSSRLKTGLGSPDGGQGGQGLGSYRGCPQYWEAAVDMPRLRTPPTALTLQINS